MGAHIKIFLLAWPHLISLCFMLYKQKFLMSCSRRYDEKYVKMNEMTHQTIIFMLRLLMFIFFTFSRLDLFCWSNSLLWLNCACVLISGITRQLQGWEHGEESADDRQVSTRRMVMILPKHNIWLRWKKMSLSIIYINLSQCCRGKTKSMIRAYAIASCNSWPLNWQLKCLHCLLLVGHMILFPSHMKDLFC